MMILLLANQLHLILMLPQLQELIVGFQVWFNCTPDDGDDDDAIIAVAVDL